MDADATRILDAIAALIAADNSSSGLITDETGQLMRDGSGAPSIRQRRYPAHSRAPQAGWTDGDPVPCWILSISEPEAIDELGDFENISVGYALRIDYVTTSPHGTFDDSPDVRKKRQRLIDLFYKPAIVGVSEVREVKATARETYVIAGGGRLSASGIILTFTVWRPRPE